MPNEVAMFDIVWDESLSNLHIGYETNLITIADMIDMGYKDISVTAPTGWVANVSLEGEVIKATLDCDLTALSNAMKTCALTIFPKDDGSGKYTVKADIAAALRGFWYVLYGSDDLTTWEAVTSGTYESGTPADRGQGTAENPISEVNLSITVTPGVPRAGVKRFYRVVTEPPPAP